jgi:hypothetical protein
MTLFGGGYGVVFYVTAALLFAGVVAAEIYRLRRGARGRVRALSAGEADFGLGGVVAEVELDDGRVVEAHVTGCTQCMCRFRAGDRVLVTRANGRLFASPAIR